ncbi:MAG: hypothetical protein IPK19_16970 [Chloroflexi bacterium]|nr:hypothetical protein [Chloroflexota bacterium]
MLTKTLISVFSPARQIIRMIGLLAIVCMLVLPVVAQNSTYTDPAGGFSLAVPAGWSDESTDEYGVFTKVGVTAYLITVEAADAESAVAGLVERFAPQVAGEAPNMMGTFPAPNGSWTQILYAGPDGKIGLAVAQPVDGRAVVLLVVADNMGELQALGADLQALNLAINVVGGSEVTARSQAQPEAAPDVTPDPEALTDVALPEPTGSYAVGRTRYIWIDDSRQDTNAPTAGDPRVINVWVWYPAMPAADADPAPYLPEDYRALFWDLYAADTASLHGHSYADAPAATSEGGYPVLIFSPGNGYNAIFSAALLEEIASHGYVVVGLDHAYNALLTTTPDGRPVNRTPQGIQQSEEAFVNRIVDVRYAIDQLAQLNADFPLLAGSLDPDRVAIFGHSFGGATAAETCRMDERCQAAIVFDVPLQGEVARSGLDKPIMLFDSERLSGEALGVEFEQLYGQPLPAGAEEAVDLSNAFRDDTAELLLGMSSDAYRLILDGSRHNTFSDMPWLVDLQSALRPELGGLPTLERDRSLRVIADYVLAFFDTVLKGASSPLLEGASPDYPEVGFSRGQD